jgi:transcriptional regulator with XRE-family HTH domain
MQRRLSQEELASRCNLERTSPSLLERGIRTPTLAIIVQLAEALQISPVHLVALTMERLAIDEGARSSARQSEARKQNMTDVAESPSPKLRYWGDVKRALLVIESCLREVTAMFTQYDPPKLRRPIERLRSGADGAWVVMRDELDAARKAEQQRQAREARRTGVPQRPLPEEETTQLPDELAAAFEFHRRTKEPDLLKEVREKTARRRRHNSCA